WCPTLAHPGGCSTIGAGGLSFRVRDGSGRFPSAMSAVTRVELYRALVCSCSGSCTVDAFCVFVVSPRPISTGQLHTLRCFHFRPINPVVWAGALPGCSGERPHLEASFPLRCFQRLSLPNVANQPCTWRYNWHTRGSSVPVLSY